MKNTDLAKRMQKRAFIENNSKILRYLNMLDSKEHKIGSIHYIMHDVALDDLRNSFHYLHDSGYIRIQHPDGAACFGLDKDTWSDIRLAITSKGMDLLMGITENPAVDV